MYRGRHRRPAAAPPPDEPIIWECSCGGCDPQWWRPRCLVLPVREPPEVVRARYTLPETGPPRHRRPHPDDPPPAPVCLDEYRRRR